MIIGSHFSAVVGGAQYQAKCIVDELAKSKDYEIFYLTRDVNTQFYPEGYKIIQIAEPVGLRRHAFFFDIRQLLKLLKQIKPDVIYQRGLKSYTGIAAYYANKNNCKMIFHAAHDYDLQHKRLEWGSLKKLPLQYVEDTIAVRGLKTVEHIVVQTRQQADLLYRNYKRKVDAIIPNFHPLPRENLNKVTQTKVVWVANFKPFKQPEVFVQLAKDLQDIEDVEFIMVGRPGDPVKYAELHEQISSLKNLSYMGELPINGVNELLATAHIFVNTSIAEGFPNTFIQAWMRKVPVVSLTFNADDVLNINNVGYCGETYEGLKLAVEKLIANEELRRDMGERAQYYAYNYYSPKNVEKLLSVIEC